MKTEIKTLIYSMVNNLLISIIKIIGGVVFGLSSLFADGLHTFSDFITDIVCFIGSKITRKKPTKYHPFGFGRVEYLTNLFVGMVLFILSAFIIIGAFGKEIVIPPISLLWLLLITFLLKLLAIIIMYKIGEEINSQLLIISVKESKTDLYSTIGVAFITILLQFSNVLPFLKYSDIIGSILIGLIVFKTAISIIIDNCLSIIGEVDYNKEIINKVKEIISKNEEVVKQKISLIKYGPYYKLQLMLEFDFELTLKEVNILEKKIKSEILRHRSLKIKYVTIYVTDEL